MLTKKQTLCWASLAVAGSFFFCGFSRAADVQLKPGFNDQYAQYLNSMPAPTPLNGAGSPDIMEVVPSYRSPFSVLKIDLAPSKTLSFSPGEKIGLAGTLSYTWKGSDNMKKIHDLCMEKVKDEKQCQMPQAYEIPQFNNLGVYIQVWRKDELADGANKGDFLVDEFYALENQNLSENDKKNFSINWTVPNELKGGNYYFLLYLNQDKAFDILGTPLVVFSETQRFDFEIKDNGSSGIELDKDNIKVGGQDYAYRRPAPTVKGNEVTVEIPLKNLDSTDQQASVKYELYRWGRTNPKDLIDSKVENKVLKANSNEPLKYTFAPNATDSVYDLKIKANTAGSETNSYVRFVMDGKHRGIFRFLSFVSNNGAYTPMFCVRDANWSGSFQGTVKLTMGGEKFEQAGTINADDGKCFIPSSKLQVKGSQCQTVKAEILDKDGKIVDTKEASVNCTEKKAVQKTGTNSSAPVKNQSDNNLIYAFILAILLLIGGVVIIKTKNKK